MILSQTTTNCFEFIEVTYESAECRFMEKPMSLTGHSLFIQPICKIAGDPVKNL